MRAENLLFVLDECDELQLLLRESLRPSALGTLLLLLISGAVSFATSSLALGVTTLVLGAWLALTVAWVNERRVPVKASARLVRRYR